MQEKQKVADEVAEIEFKRFIEAFDLDWEAEDLDDEDKKSFAQMKAPVLRAITRGNLCVDNAGQPVFAAGDNLEAITFREPSGKVVLNNKGELAGERMRALMRALTGEPEARFDGMQLRDLKVCMALTNLVFTSR